MAAPVALKPFVRALAELEPHVAQAFTPWLPRLALLVGSLARVSKPGGDVDGVDGVAQRGPYERLLLSEWAIALEHPDEFSRRAAMNEHLFVDLKRREPQGALHSLLLVDSGPDQLGSPRILHLAAALVAEARARRAKAAFAWGALTEPVRVFSAVTPESVRHVLDARRATPLQPASLERWHLAVQHFTGRDVPAETGEQQAQVDVLFVGGAHLERTIGTSPFAGEARLLRIDPLAGACDASLVTPLPPPKRASPSPSASSSAPARVATLGPRSRPLRLTLPDEATCVRSLRDPFEAEVKHTPPVELEIDPHGGICIPPGGRRVFVRTADGVAALLEPNSPRAPLGPAKRVVVPPNHIVVAAGLVGKRPLVIVRSSLGLRALFAGQSHGLSGDVYQHSPDGDEPQLFAEDAYAVTRESARVTSDGKLERDDRVRMLWTMPGEVPFESAVTPVPLPYIDGRARAFIDGTRAYALLPYHRRIVELSAGQLVPPFAHRGDKLNVTRAVDVADMDHAAHGIFIRANSSDTRHVNFDRAPTHAFLGAIRVHGRVPGVLAVGDGSGIWRLIHATDPTIVIEAPGVDVLGATYHPAHGPCVVGREDARRLAILGKGAIERHAFSFDICDVAPNLELPQLAVLTKDGTVTMLYLKTGTRSIVARGSGPHGRAKGSVKSQQQQQASPRTGLVNLMAARATAPSTHEIDEDDTQPWGRKT